MAQEFAKPFYNSAAWQKCRASYISGVHGLCEVCNKPGYHKIELNPTNINDPEVTLNHDNLIYVCKDCHEREHHGDVLRYRFDGDGMPIPPGLKV